MPNFCAAASSMLQRCDCSRQNWRIAPFCGDSSESMYCCCQRFRNECFGIHNISVTEDLASMENDPFRECWRRSFCDSTSSGQVYRWFVTRFDCFASRINFFLAFGNVGALFSVYSLLCYLPVWIEVGQTNVFFQVCRRALQSRDWPSISIQVY